MHEVWITTPNNHRLVKTDHPEKYKNNPNAMIDPDRSLVKGVAPHKWRPDRVNNRFLPMTNGEAGLIEKHQKKHGVINSYDSQIKRPRYRPWLRPAVIAVAALSVAAALFVMRAHILP